jgi:hypothetical protein
MLKTTQLFIATLLFGFAVFAAADNGIDVIYQLGRQSGEQQLIALRIIEFSPGLFEAKHLSYLELSPHFHNQVEYIDFSLINISDSIFAMLHKTFPILKQIHLQGNEATFLRNFREVYDKLTSSGIKISYEADCNLDEAAPSFEWLPQMPAHYASPQPDKSKPHDPCIIA